MKTYPRAVRSRNYARLCATLIVTAFLGHQVSFAQEPSLSPSILKDLRNGGFVLYIRHASTESDYADQIKADVHNCSTQRTLSEKGWQEASLIGASMDILSIPVGAVYSSEYCRAWQTAQIAFGRYTKRSELNFEPAEEYTADQLDAMRERVLPLLKMEPSPGTNTVFVGHDDPFEAAIGIYPEPQGVTYVLKRDTAGEMQVVGSVPPSAWQQLLVLR